MIQYTYSQTALQISLSETKEKITNTSHLNNLPPPAIHDHGKLIEKELNDWRGELEQIDDVCIIGIKV